MTMQKGAFMRGIDKMIIKEIPVPEIGKKEVLVSLEYVGICGSDVHYFHNGCCGSYKVDLSEDYMLGHEEVEGWRQSSIGTWNYMRRVRTV